MSVQTNESFLWQAFIIFHSVNHVFFSEGSPGNKARNYYDLRNIISQVIRRDHVYYESNNLLKKCNDVFKTLLTWQFWQWLLILFDSYIKHFLFFNGQPKTIIVIPSCLLHNIIMYYIDTQNSKSNEFANCFYEVFKKTIIEVCW